MQWKDLEYSEDLARVPAPILAGIFPSSCDERLMRNVFELVQLGRKYEI